MKSQEYNHRSMVLPTAKKLTRFNITKFCTNYAQAKFRGTESEDTNPKQALDASLQSSKW